MNVVLIRNSDKVVTEDEAEIVRLLSQGHRNDEISTILKIRKRTLTEKLKDLRASYDAKTSAQLCCIFKDLEII